MQFNGHPQLPLHPLPLNQFQIWAHLSGVPLDLRHTQGLSLVAGLVGDPKETDDFTINLVSLILSHVKVAVDLTKPLQQSWNLCVKVVKLSKFKCLTLGSPLLVRTAKNSVMSLVTASSFLLLKSRTYLQKRVLSQLLLLRKINKKCTRILLQLLLLPLPSPPTLLVPNPLQSLQKHPLPHLLLLSLCQSPPISLLSLSLHLSPWCQILTTPLLSPRP